MVIKGFVLPQIIPNLETEYLMLASVTDPKSRRAIMSSHLQFRSHWFIFCCTCSFFLY
jgi:hypothetical protein